MFSNQIGIDCGRLMADFYTNTPEVSQVRNNTSSVIFLRWNNSFDPQKAIVEFYNYNSTVLPYQQATTITSRSSFGIYPRTAPSAEIPPSGTIIVPPFAKKFRIRLDKNGPLVTNYAPVHNNGMYYIEGGFISEFYSF